MLAFLFYYEEYNKRYPYFCNDNFKLPTNANKKIRNFMKYDFYVLDSLFDETNEYIRKVKEEYINNDLYPCSINAFYEECPVMFQDKQIYEWFKIPIYVNDKQKLLCLLNGKTLTSIKENHILIKKLTRYHSDINKFN